MIEIKKRSHSVQTVSVIHRLAVSENIHKYV